MHSRALSHPRKPGPRTREDPLSPNHMGREGRDKNNAISPNGAPPLQEENALDNLDKHHDNTQRATLHAIHGVGRMVFTDHER